ncbi:MAG: phosphatase PAP2 family protein [Prevotella sp.]|nr:phosphatase PAP2 family protein [Prevotella sp.]
MSRQKSIIYLARFVSMLFTPFYLPLMGLILLFTLSYLALLPIVYRLEVVIIVYLFTILLPTFIIHVYRRYQGWNLIELGHRERRMVPYVLSIMCYMLCTWLLRSMNVFHFVSSILMAALLIQIVCAVINVWWKISTHTAAIGGVAGALMAFAEIFGFNPVWWLCGVLCLAGVMGSARMILRQHSLSQVVAGFGVGFLCAVFGILFL